MVCCNYARYPRWLLYNNSTSRFRVENSIIEFFFSYIPSDIGALAQFAIGYADHIALEMKSITHRYNPVH